jgi:hypothetical protein
MLDYPLGSPNPTFKTLMAYVGPNVGPASLILDKSAKEGDLLPVIFVDNHGRQSELTYVPVHGPETIKESFIKDKDEVSGDVNDQSIQSITSSRTKNNSRRNRERLLTGSNKGGQVVIDGRKAHKTPSQSDHTSVPSSSQRKSKNGSSHTSSNVSSDSKKSKQVGRGGSSHTSRQSSPQTSQQSSKKNSSQNDDVVGSVSSHSHSDDEVNGVINTENDVDEDIELNFTRARNNFEVLDKMLENKFMKRLKLEYDENVGGDTIAKLSDYTNIVSFEVLPDEIDLSKFDVEKPEGDLIHVRDGKLEIVYAKIVNQSGEDNKSQNQDDLSESAEESQHNDFDIFLSLENSQGAKEDDKMFIIINLNDQTIYEEEIKIADVAKDFLENDETVAEQIRIVFIDQEKNLMSNSLYAKVVNHITTEDKFDSFDEKNVELTFENYQAVNGSALQDLKSLKLDAYNKVTDVKIVQDVTLAQNAGDKWDSLEVLEIQGNNTVFQIFVSDSRRMRMLLV